MDRLRIETPSHWLAARLQYSTTSSNASSMLYEAAANTTATQMIISELKFAAAKSIRTSTIILASFNAIAAFATACGILYDAYSTRRMHQKRPRMRDPSPFINAAEVYPLVISVGITIQGVGFAVAQAQGLDGLLSTGCTLVSQFMLPAVFIVPYIQLVFGAEFALRGLRAKPFPARGKYNTPVCLAVVGLLLLTNFLVADFVRSPDLCFASLFWFVAMYSRGSFAVLLVIDIVLVTSVVTIFVRLTRSTQIEVPERVSASRMVYYLALAILSVTLIMPFFFTLGFVDLNNSGSQSLTFSMVASVVANLSGLMTGGLYLFLRSSAISTIGPRDKTGESKRQRIKNQIRRFGSHETDGGSGGSGSSGHMMRPVSGADEAGRMLSDASPISGTHGDSLGKDDVGASAIRAPESAQLPSAIEFLAASSASSILSSAAPSVRGKTTSSPEPLKSLLLLPATTYKPGGRFDLASLKPPPSLRNLASRHRRDSSMASSATVQIGLRLSNVDDLPPMSTHVLDQKVYTLEDNPADDALDRQIQVLQAQQVQPQQPLPPPYWPQQKRVLPMGGLSLQTANLPLPSQPAPVRRPSPLATADVLGTDSSVVASDGEDEDAALAGSPVADASPRRDPVKDARMKTLPPVPKSGERTGGDYGARDIEEGDAPTLSPSVYSEASPTQAASKLPSPRGVGVTAMPSSRSNSSAALRVPPLFSPQRGDSSASRVAASRKGGDWI